MKVGGREEEEGGKRMKVGGSVGEDSDITVNLPHISLKLFG